MKEFIIEKNDSGMRLDKFLSKAVPLLPPSLRSKYIRIKRIKLFGKRVEAAYMLRTGDVLQCYINDEFFEDTTDSAYLMVKPDFSIVYEDEQLLLVNKKVGLLVHSENKEDVNTLITQIQSYLYTSGQWDPKKEQSFTPALCNRIDRNTSGIVIAAKTAEALRILNEKIKERDLTKKYICVVLGALKEKQGRFDGFILKDSEKNTVSVYKKQVIGAKSALTLYRVLAEKDGLSLVECELVTGRTHQIRAHFAAAGHPLLGDGKYGHNQTNLQYGRSYQALCSYYLKFSFSEESGALSYLKGREFRVKNIDFVEKYFPEFLF